MIFKLYIPSSENHRFYGVNSDDSHTISSKKEIKKVEVKKIQEILGSFINLQIATVNMNERTVKYNKHQPEEGDIEKTYFENASQRLEDAKQHYAEIKAKYNITEITKEK